MNAPDHEHKSVTIIVNTRDKTVEKGKVSYDQIVALALDPVPSGPNIEITVTFNHGHSNHSGDLRPGDSVEVVDGMVFDVTATDLS
ncbi:MAG: hypothetical protein QOE42_432 [Chloroflexota bacterium]|jgi:hypothetical protein|nr:hypothetical protein [Chloroflexota bacterium]